MKKILSWLLASTLFFMFHPATAQLKVGDKVPDIIINNLLNYPASKARLSDLKADLTLLEFWSFNCASCIEGFPKLEQLQQKFGKKIRIIAVNNDSENATRAFFAKHKKIIMPRIPFATGDTTLKKLFPRNFNPWLIWIDKNRVVRHITGVEPFLEKDIDSFLNGGPLDSEELEPQTKDRGMPLIAKENGKWLDKIHYYSFIANCITTVSVGNYTIPAKPGDQSYLSRNCFSLLHLLVDAFTEGMNDQFFLGATIDLQVQDSSRFIQPDDPYEYKAWKEFNSYSYDLNIPGKSKKELFEVFKKDLLQYFNLECFIEKRPVVITLLSRYSTPSTFTQQPNESYVSIPYYSLLLLMQTGARTKKIPAFINNVGVIDESMLVHLSEKTVNNLNIITLEKELLLNGFSLVKKEVLTDILVIKEK